MRTNNSKALHEIVAEKIIKQLSEGTAPWQIPWNSNGPAFELPYNIITGNRYKGLNIFSLLSAEKKDPRWLTFKQASEKGWSIKRGEKATLIQFVKTHDYRTQKDQHGKIITGDNGKPLKDAFKLDRPIITTAWVFNAQQISGIEPLKQNNFDINDWDPIQRAENLIAESKAMIIHNDEDKAYYNPSKDQIVLPFKTQFASSDMYYATLLHELGHWTSHKDRLHRDIINAFGSRGYAREELRAEIASMLLGHELKIGHDPNQHISYVESWIKLLKDNSYEIQTAALDAEKIFNYILKFDRQRGISTTNQIKEHTVDLRSQRDKKPSLNMGDLIVYNNTYYKVHSLLKRGRFKVEDISNGNNFILSKSDVLYTSLISAKYHLNMTPITIVAKAEEAPYSENQTIIKSIKR